MCKVLVTRRMGNAEKAVTVNSLQIEAGECFVLLCSRSGGSWWLVQMDGSGRGATDLRPSWGSLCIIHSSSSSPSSPLVACCLTPFDPRARRTCSTPLPASYARPTYPSHAPNPRAPVDPSYSSIPLRGAFLRYHPPQTVPETKTHPFFSDYHVRMHMHIVQTTSLFHILGLNFH